jgi:hypothetical protein
MWTDDSANKRREKEGSLEQGRRELEDSIVATALASTEGKKKHCRRMQMFEE